MSTDFPIVSLEKVLQQRSEFIEIDDLATYKRCRVQLHAQGIIERDSIQGTEIKTKRQQICRTGEFLVAEIDAKVGGFGIVPDKLHGAIVSSHYFLFEIDETALNRFFLEFYIRTPTFMEQVRAQGSTNYAAIRPSGVLKYKIPLPPLEEQQRIVARIEELAGRIEEARGLRREAVEEANVLFTCAINEVWSDQSTWNVRLVRDLATAVSGQIDPLIEPYASLPHINGEAIESGTCRLLSYRSAHEDGVTSGKFHFRAGSVLYSKIRPYLRKAVQVPVEGICSADIYAFESIASVLNPRFFMYSLISPDFTKYANTLSGRTRMPKLNQDQLFSFQMSYPPLSVQHQIVNYLDSLQKKISTLKQVQSETSAELDALLPSILDKAFKGEL